MFGMKLLSKPFFFWLTSDRIEVRGTVVNLFIISLAIQITDTVLIVMLTIASQCDSKCMKLATRRSLHSWLLKS